MANFTKGKRIVRDKSAGGLVMAGLFPYAVEIEGDGQLARFVSKADAILDAKAPQMYEALKEIIEQFAKVDKLYSKDREVIQKSQQLLAEIEEEKWT